MKTNKMERGRGGKAAGSEGGRREEGGGRREGETDQDSDNTVVFDLCKLNEVR